MGILERFWLVILIAAPLAAIVAEPAPIAKPDCQDKCGDVSIPYPFGTREGCYYNEDFLISCNDTSSPPLAFLDNSTINVINITLEGRVQIMNLIARDCYDKLGNQITVSGGSNRTGLRLNFNSIYTISDNENMFLAVGCDTGAEVTGFVQGDRRYTAGCKTICDRIDYVANDTCSSIGCCQISIAKGMSYMDITVRSYQSHKKVWTFNPCSYGFVVEQSQLDFSPKLLRELQNVSKLPMVLDWSIRDENDKCGKTEKAKACQGNSTCVPVDDNGYRCKCLDGYEGNPYLPSGCQDRDECSPPNRNPCKGGMICTNTEGNYTCSCPKGYHHVVINDEQGCVTVRRKWNLLLGGCLGFGVACLFTIGTWQSYKILKKRRKMKLQRQFFKQNGGLLLQQQLSSTMGNIEKTKIFSIKELEKATNYFNGNRILGQGGQGTVYKGMLVDGRIIAVKKSKGLDKAKVKEFINEVVILTQINHRNIVKLLGCCLETEVPLLVYEFIPNGTLFQYIHDENEDFPLTWERRVTIAAEVAGALSYLHSSASIPIYHRDVKSSNILLDEKYKAKVSDFGTSRLISIDQTHLTTNVKGTFGYLDPEYFQSSQFTEKSDVYSFGVVLVELLTGQKPISLTEVEEARGLAAHFILSMEQNNLFNILDPRVKESSDLEEITKVAKLAYQCLSLSGKKRPRMIEVAVELEQIYLLQNKSNGQQNHEKTSYVKIEATNQWDGASTSTLSLDIESLFSSES
ncbi:hypothetical protein SLEP1_g11425 [Rubroshorea leprosula]|uniref:Uncharacterized protein n=1 Tax=Rubroshorea leprosula TaxID=152421 RepID=A0AAV5IH25_9ROSI|nr:hypothetical protein SLEP1_g11425 [Rubroshorea leprosula]